MWEERSMVDDFFWSSALVFFFVFCFCQSWNPLSKILNLPLNWVVIGPFYVKLGPQVPAMVGNQSLTLGRSRPGQEKNCPPENFYRRIKFFSGCVENFCPTLKNFVRPAGHVWHCFPWRFQCYWLHVNVFPTVYNLFHHTPRMISDSFLATRRATPRRKSSLEKRKAFIRRIKKPVLNPTLTLTLVLRAKYNDVFHCLYEGKFLVSLRWSRVGPASPGHLLQP